MYQCFNTFENSTRFTYGALSVSSGGEMMQVKVVTMETSESSEEELGRLDIDLDRKSKQHNLTSSNVRAILHVSVQQTHKDSIDETCHMVYMQLTYLPSTACLKKKQKTILYCEQYSMVTVWNFHSMITVPENNTLSLSHNIHSFKHYYKY